MLKLIENALHLALTVQKFTTVTRNLTKTCFLKYLKKQEKLKYFLNYFTGKKHVFTSLTTTLRNIRNDQVNIDCSLKEIATEQAKAATARLNLFMLFFI